jgi:hypothetical protein
MSCGYIYKIVFPNGNHYIGMTTTSLEQRTREHKITAKKGDTKCLYNALRKYNMVDTLELIEIDTADSIEELCEKEIGYIIVYNSYYMSGMGYNMTYGGEGVNGYIYTEEIKQKMSEIKKKLFENPEAIQKNSEALKQYYKDNSDAIQKNREAQLKYNQEHPEKGKKHSEIMKKLFENPEAIQKNREVQIQYNQEHPEKGKEHSEIMKKLFENPDARQQMSEIKKQYHKDNPDAGKEHSEKLIQHYIDPEARQKCSEAQKKRFENPEARKQMSDIKKKLFESPEARAKNSEAQKKYNQDNPDHRQKLLDKKGQNKPFDVFTKDGIFIKKFTYQYQAKEFLQKEYNITTTIAISVVLSGKYKSSAGFVFKYK